MRRPLCAAGAVYLAVLFLFQCLFPISYPKIGIFGNDPEGTGRYEDVIDSSDTEISVTVCGNVQSREYRTYAGVRTPVIYVRTESITKGITECINEQNVKEHHIIACRLGEEETPPPVGCRICIRGKISLYDKATNPGEFDMCRYEQTLGVDAKMRDTSVTARSVSYDAVKEKLACIRDRSSCMLNRLFGEHNGGILSAMVLGDKSNLDENLKAMYKRNGIIHILAISGLHISLIGIGIYSLLRKCRLHTAAAALISVAVMYFYGVMCGMASSAERAVIMFAFGMAARMIGRTYDLVTALCSAAVIIATEQPLYLQNSGFLFSFGAVFAIGIFLPAAEDMYPGPDMRISGVTEEMKKSIKYRISRKIKEKYKSLRSVFVSGAVIAIVTLPVHLYFYYEFPLFSLILNILVIPLMTFVMSGTLIGLALSYIWSPLGRIMVLPVGAILELYEKGCMIGDTLPVNNIITGQPDDWKIVVYCVLVILIFMFHRYIPRFLFPVFISASVMIMIIHGGNCLNMIFADVGQGDGIYISDTRGFDILVDGGSSTKKNVGRYQLEPLVKSQGAGMLDAVFITHLDSDHYNGILEMIELSDEGGVRIGEIVMNSAVYNGGGDKLSELVTLASSHDIPVAEISAGTVIRRGKLVISCLYPGEDSTYSEDDLNASSTVLLVRYGDFTSLLTGDLEGSGETELMKVLPKQEITVLKVAHHGSRNSTSAGFLNEVRPKVSVLSAGRGNRYGHPHSELLKRLDSIGTERMCTIYTGAVIVRACDDGRVTVCGFNDQK